MAQESPLMRFVSILAPLNKKAAVRTDPEEIDVQTPESKHARLLDAIAMRGESIRGKFEDLVGAWEKTKQFNERLDDGLNEVLSLLSTLADAEKSISQLKIKLDGVSTDCLQLKERHAALELRARTDRDELLEQKIESSSKQVMLEALRLELNQANRTIDDSRIQKSSLEEELSHVSREKQLCDNEICRLEDELAKSDSEKAGLLSERSTLRTKLSLEIEERSSASKEISSLSEQLLERNRSLRVLEEQLRERDRFIISLRDEISAANAREAQASENKEALIRSVSASEDKISSLQADIVSWKEKETSLLHRVDALQSRLRLTEKLLYQAREEVSTFSSKDNDLSKQVRANKELQGRLNDMEAELRTLRDQKSDLEGAMLASRQQGGLYRSEISRLENLLEQASGRIGALEKDLRADSEKHGELNEKLHGDLSRFKELRAKDCTEIAYLNGVVRALRAENECLKARNKANPDGKDGSSLDGYLIDHSAPPKTESKSKLNSEKIVLLHNKE